MTQATMSQAKAEQLELLMKEYASLKRRLAEDKRVQRFAALKAGLKSVFEAIGCVDSPFVGPGGLHGMLKTTESVGVAIPKETRTALKNAHGDEVKMTRTPVTVTAEVTVQLNASRRLKIYQPDAEEESGEVDIAEEFLRDVAAGDHIPSEVEEDVEKRVA